MDYTVKSKGVQYTAQLDDCDSDLLLVKWYRHQDKSTDSAYMNRNTGGVTYVMHRIIMARILGRALQRHELVGHVDLDGLNNRRANLYLGDSQKVGSLRRVNSHSTTGVKGVQPNRKGDRYAASFKCDGVWHYVGTYDTVEDAAKAYAVARGDLT